MNSRCKNPTWDDPLQGRFAGKQCACCAAVPAWFIKGLQGASDLEGFVLW